MTESVVSWISLLSPVAMAVFGYLFLRDVRNRDENLEKVYERLEKLSVSQLEIQRKQVEAQDHTTETLNKLANSLNLLAQSVSHIDKDVMSRHDAVLKLMDNNTHEIEKLRVISHWLVNRIGILKMYMEMKGVEFQDKWDPPA